MAKRRRCARAHWSAVKRAETPLHRMAASLRKQFGLTLTVGGRTTHIGYSRVPPSLADRHGRPRL